MLKKKRNSKLQGASARSRDFKGPTIKPLRQYVIPALGDDSLDIVVIHEECNNLGYKKRSSLCR